MHVHDHAQCHGINQSEVAVHQFGEGGFGMPPDVIEKSFAVGSFVHSATVTRGPEKRTAHLNRLRSVSTPTGFALLSPFLGRHRREYPTIWAQRHWRRRLLASSRVSGK